MRLRLIVVAAALLSLPLPAFAHRLDEYLQATLLTVQRDQVEGSMRLVPGVAVVPAVMASIDTNGDSVISVAEQQAYAGRVLNDLTLSLDGHHLQPRLLSVNFPDSSQMKAGLGEIQIEFTAELPPGGVKRTLTFENHHQSGISVYLVNTLVPQDNRIQITAQNRNQNQSFYQLNFEQGSVLFQLGVRHIAEGTDHLLFLLTLLLPAPLLVVHSRWAGYASVRQSLLQILKVVTAFTVGHSITLAIAALGRVHVPSRPVEVLIAISILVSAVHALRPLFPGREAAIAAFFGLIHGLAFATTLTGLGLGRWERVTGILGFNLGIEAMQLVVVAATLPSLLLLSRTSAYSALRIGGAFFAGAASLGWVVERLLGVHTPADLVVNVVAHHALWIAVSLFAVSVVCWSGSRWQRSPGDPVTAPEF